MMQGDVPYKSLPEAAKFETENPYEYLVVPHHGSQMDYSLLKCNPLFLDCDAKVRLFSQPANIFAKKITKNTKKNAFF